jgi:transcriptional regulator with XRE-family HTH domain
MESTKLGQHIRELRKQFGYSQEDLAESIFVSRQTISNWENAKSYPDITSLILLSQTFNQSIDKLVEGDFEMMKQTIEHADIINLKRNSNLMLGALTLGVILLLISVYAGNIAGMIISGAIAIFGLWMTTRVVRITKKHDIQTYREIVAFINGEKLDTIAQARESGKRMYQKWLLVITCIILDIIVLALIAYAVFYR